MWEVNKENLALKWFEAGIFLDKTRSPEGKGFRLKLHETNPNAPLSPFYMNFRLLRSFPELMADSAELLAHLMSEVENQPDLVADVPTAATPLVALIAAYREIPMVTPRERKTHGTGAVIDGKFTAGQSVALFDDLITRADSKLESISVLEEAGLKVSAVLMFLDRQQGGMEQLIKAGYTARAAFTITELLQLFRHHQRISGELHEEILDYLFPEKTA